MDSDSESNESADPATYSEEEEEEEEEREQAAAMGIQPYMFEPFAPEPRAQVEGDAGGAVAGGEPGEIAEEGGRLGNNDW